jgi:serine/tyrosine/threonine adenylyltransferase
MMQKLGFEESDAERETADDLLSATIELLQTTQVNYHEFFAALRQNFSELWRADAGHILSESPRESPLFADPEWDKLLQNWRHLYHRMLELSPASDFPKIAACLRQHNPLTVIVRPEIEAVWEPIMLEDNWQPFYNLLKRLSD